MKIYYLFVHFALCSSCQNTLQNNVPFSFFLNRNLVKKYCPKRSSKDEEPRFTSCIAFFNILNELNDYAGQREVVAEEMGHRVYGELMRYSHDLKTERKMHLQEGRKAQQYLDMCWKQMDNVSLCFVCH